MLASTFSCLAFLMAAMRRLRCRVRGVTNRWILGQRLRFLPLTSKVRLWVVMVSTVMLVVVSKLNDGKAEHLKKRVFAISTYVYLLHAWLCAVCPSACVLVGDDIIAHIVLLAEVEELADL